MYYITLYIIFYIQFSTDAFDTSTTGFDFYAEIPKYFGTVYIRRMEQSGVEK